MVAFPCLFIVLEGLGVGKPTLRSSRKARLPNRFPTKLGKNRAKFGDGRPKSCVMDARLPTPQRQARMSGIELSRMQDEHNGLPLPMRARKTILNQPERG